MFNLRRFKLVKELKDSKTQQKWIEFSNSKNNISNRDEIINSIVAENKFVEEDLKIRTMVEEMLVKEFSEDIKNIKSYDFLVDSVVNKLKNKQLDTDLSKLEDIK